MRPKIILTIYKRRKYSENLKGYLREGQVEKIKEILSQLDFQEIAGVLNRLTEEEILKLFKFLDLEKASQVLVKIKDTAQKFLLQRLNQDFIIKLLEVLPPDDVVDLLSKVSPKEAKNLIERMSLAKRENLEKLLKYPEDTAGGLMTTEFVAILENLKAEEVMQKIYLMASSAKTIYYIYVINQEKRLVGVLSLRELLISFSKAPKIPIKEIMKTQVINVEANMNQEKVAEIVSKYDLGAIPVVDEKQRLLGIITADDIINVVKEETAEDLYKMGGMVAEKDQLIDASIFQVVKARIPWLLVCLAGGLIAGNIIGIFEASLKAVIALAFFIPVIMDMGGNAGTQSATIIVRGIATGQINPKEIWKIVIFKEFQIGLVLGILSGILVGIVAGLWQRMIELGMVVGISMFLTVTLAATLGGMLPPIFKFLNVDPALASGPFITTIKDITALCIYFGIALLLMGHLM